ncbi:terminase small subunit [Lachnospiraceae bacterium CLA-AA-H215]|uniref:Terminase small subunit n=1 Tax=Hominifimenecus microfluidus TaxID=2885348 RepID=A0AAE3ECP7_9FIRM|nr:terminase small subunit [Hominifimenecus microfluidus]MCC2232394.1 terminase small subunit [Hominifimenecus microfluidus]
MALTEKQKRFAEEYLMDLNATQAAIRAGYSAKTANEQGSRLLANVSIQKAISKAIAERSGRTKISQDRVVNELAKIAFLNIADLIDQNGNMKSNVSRDDMAGIEWMRSRGIETENGYVKETEFRLTSKLKALELLGRHLGMFTDRVELSGLQAEQGKLDALIQQLRE